MISKLSSGSTPEIRNEKPAGKTKKCGEPTKNAKSKEIKDVAAISPAAKTGTLTRAQGVQLISALARTVVYSEPPVFTPKDDECGILYLPFVEQKERTEPRTNPIAKKLLGENKTVKARSVQISFMEMLNRLENKKPVVLKSFRYAPFHETGNVVRKLVPYQNPYEEEANLEFRSFDELAVALPEVDPRPEDRETPSAKDILKHWKNQIVKDATCHARIMYFPLVKDEKRLKHVDNSEAYRILNRNEKLRPEEREPVFIQVVHAWRTAKTPLGGAKGGVTVKPNKVTTGAELQEFYRMID